MHCNTVFFFSPHPAFAILTGLITIFHDTVNIVVKTCQSTYFCAVYWLPIAGSYWPEAGAQIEKQLGAIYEQTI